MAPSSESEPAAGAEADAAPGEISMLLEAAHRGDRDALDRLVPRVHMELRRLAQSALRRERGDHTLQPTALVNEVWLKFVGQDSLGFRHRAPFFAAAATVMRRILVDHARAKATTKRGGELQRQPLDDVIDQLEAQGGGNLLELEVALDELAKDHPRKARLVELKFFLGLGMRDCAQVLAVSLREVERDWTLTRAWLARRLRLDDPT